MLLIYHSSPFGCLFSFDLGKVFVWNRFTYSLAQRSALANGDLVTLLNTESRGDVSGQVLVSLLISVILGNEVKVFAANDDGTVHLGGDDSTSQDTTADGNEAGERAFLVFIKTLVLGWRNVICG